MSKIKITRSSELNTATWAGGTTTQLAIFPETATYKEFNFDYRISFATVKVDESTFTFMPGVTRHLMILKGNLEIEHIDRYTMKLGKFDKDTFSGEWPTRAKGKVTDFNLMTRGSYSGNLEARIIKPNEKLPLLLDHFATSVYVVKGSCTLNSSESINEGDFVIFDKSKSPSDIFSSRGCEVVIGTVSQF